MLSAGLLEELPEVPLGGSQLDIGGLAFQGDMGSGGFAPGGSAGGGDGGGNKMLDRGINTAIVLGASTYALTKLLTVDQDYWHVRTSSFIPPSNCCSWSPKDLCFGFVLDSIRLDWIACRAGPSLRSCATCRSTTGRHTRRPSRQTRFLPR
jgi:hypothetical protein